MEDKIRNRIIELEKLYKPLFDEYDKNYKMWHEGHKTGPRGLLLQEYEDGAKGNRMFSLAERILELKSLLNNSTK